MPLTYLFKILYRWVVESQMEAAHARKAFPCFDEPEFKAQFKLTVINHKTLSAMSNMPVSTVQPM